MAEQRLYVRNFHKYQHYRKRRPPWVKLHRQILEDEKLMALPPEHRWIAVGLVILASESEPSSGGSRRVEQSEKEIGRRLGASTQLVRAAVKSLQSVGFLASSPLARR